MIDHLRWVFTRYAQKEPTKLVSYPPALESVHVAASKPFCSACGQTAKATVHFGPDARHYKLGDLPDIEAPYAGTLLALARSVFKVDPEAVLYEGHRRFPGVVFIQLSDKILADAVKCAAWHQKCAGVLLVAVGLGQFVYDERWYTA